MTKPKQPYDPARVAAVVASYKAGVRMDKTLAEYAKAAADSEPGHDLRAPLRFVVGALTGAQTVMDAYYGEAEVFHGYDFDPAAQKSIATAIAEVQRLLTAAQSLAALPKEPGRPKITLPTRAAKAEGELVALRVPITVARTMLRDARRGIKAVDLKADLIGLQKLTALQMNAKPTSKQ